MKKLLLLITLLFGISSLGFSEEIIPSTTFTTTPTEVSAQSPITINFDMKDYDFEGKWGDAYVWIWMDGASSGPVISLGDWNNSSEAYKMTRVGTSSIYSFTFTPTTLWPTVAVADMKKIGFLVKDKQGNAKTVDLTINLGESDVIITVTPSSFNSADQVTLTVEANNVDIANDWGDAYIWIWQDGIGNPEGQGDWSNTAEEFKMTLVPNTNKYSFTFTPTELWPGIPGDLMTKIGFLVKDKTGANKLPNNYLNVTPGGFTLGTAGIVNGQNIQLGNSVSFTSTSSETADLSVYIDGVKMKQTAAATSITYDFTPTVAKSGIIEIKALKDGQTISNKYTYMAYEPNVVAPRPAGARTGISYPTTTSARLVLFAPNKNNVFVVGDFNNWEVSTPYQLKQDGDYYWIDITNLNAGTEYAFQYIIDGSIKVADPYAEKILDPWNDKYIEAATYPNLKAYPEGKTEGIVSVLQPGQAPYAWEVDNFKVPEDSKLMIYELHIRDFDDKHTYQGVLDHLDYLENLNINVLELMPVNEFDGNDSWGYNPTFYFAPDKYYGPKNELKKLVDECHKRGIAVVLDLVLNHSWGQSPFLLMYENGGKPTSESPWYNENHNFTNPAAQWGADFNHESLHTRALVDSINSFWMSEYHVDGFRFDFTKGFSNNIKGGDDEWGSKYDAQRIYNLKRMSTEIWNRKSDALVICEHLAENSEEKELANHGLLLWGNVNHPAAQALMGYDDNDFSAADYRNKQWNDQHLVAYMESHDEERISFKAKEYGAVNGSYDVKELSTMTDRLCAAGALFYLIPGPKMVWQFGELGYDYSIDENGRTGRKPIRWDYFDDVNRRKVYDAFARIAELKSNDEVFTTIYYDLNVGGRVKSINLRYNDKHVIIVGNLDVSAQSINVNVPTSGTWYDMMENHTTDLNQGQHTFNLEPGEYYILSNYDPGLHTDIKDTPKEKLTNVYPVPASDVLHVNSKEAINSYEVYDIIGNKIQIKNIDKGANEIWDLPVNTLNSGVYFLILKHKNNNNEKVMFIVR